MYPIEVKFRKDGKIPKSYLMQIEDVEELNWNSSNEDFERILNSTSTWRECLVIIVTPQEPYFLVYYPGKWLKKELAIKENPQPLNRSFPSMLIYEKFEKQLFSKYSKLVKKYLS